MSFLRDCIPLIITIMWQSPGTWRNPCIVHVTMVAKDRQPLFGTLIHNGTSAEVEKTPLGWVLINEQQRLLQLCPEIRILADKVMPDHHHLILQVTSTMPRSIKEVVRGYMQGCKKAAAQLGYTEPLFDDAPHFRVLTHKGQLKAMINYVYANVERSWLKHQHPELFQLKRETTCSVSSVGIESQPSILLRFSSMGNHWLLDWPERQFIEMSRSATDNQINETIQSTLTHAKNGSITITAAVSEGEKRVARAVREGGYPLVVLLTEGFPKQGSEAEHFYKPGGVYFNICAAGKLLLLEPTEDTFLLPIVIAAVEKAAIKKAEDKHLEYVPIPQDSKRWRFLALNQIGKMIAEK